MPILPIDLQTLFTQMNHVGKDQAVQKEGVEVHQGMRGLVNVIQTEQKDNSVNQSKEVGQGLEKVKDDAKKQEQKEKKEKEEQERQKELESRKYFTDPDCGNHIDITR